jgi:hypothetical protein
MTLTCPFGRGLTRNYRRTQSKNITHRKRTPPQLTLRYSSHLLQGGSQARHAVPLACHKKGSATVNGGHS